MTGTVVLLTVVAVCVGVVLYIIVAYNTFVKLGKTMAAALSDVDVFLKKRYDLVPNLVSVVKGYAAHESGVFREAAELRTRAVHDPNVGEMSSLDQGLTGLFGRLFALAEAYPELKADTGFLNLQSELVELEDGIEHARRYYNAVVRDYNIHLESFPSNVVGGMFNFRPGEFYEVSSSEERMPVGPGFDKAD